MRSFLVPFHPGSPGLGGPDPYLLKVRFFMSGIGTFLNHDFMMNVGFWQLDHFQPLPSLTQFLGLLLVAISLGLLYRLVKLRSKHRPTDSLTTFSEIPKHIDVQPRCLLTKDESTLYNLVCLAVRDSYLVLAKLPIWTVLKISGISDSNRKLLFRQLHPSTIDFILIHPGTLLPAQVVFLQNYEKDQGFVSQSAQFLDAIFREAKIEVLRLPAHTMYTIPQLEQLFGLAEEE